MIKFVCFMLILISALVYAGQPRTVFVAAVDHNDQEYDFSKFPYDNVTFDYWIASRPGEVLDQDTPGSGYETFDQEISAISLDLQHFPTPWEAGDVLMVQIKQDDNPFDTIYYQGECDSVIADNSPTPISIGFDKYFGPGNGGIPIEIGLLAGGSPTSTITYPCITTAGTDLNLVGLPFDNGWTKASDFDTNGTNLDAVSHWSTEHQGWYTAGYHPALGWGTDFNVETGKAYMINALNNFDLPVTGQYSKEDYDLTFDLNMIIHPICKYQLDSLTEIGDDIGTDYCKVISKWDAVNQGWYTVPYSIFGWSGDAPCQAGDGLFINMTDSLNWPNKNSAKGGSGPRVIYFNLIDTYTGKALVYDDYRRIEFSAFINIRPSEILHEYDYGCGFTMIDTFSVAYVNVGNFDTPWNSEEQIDLVMTNFDAMFGCEMRYNTLDDSSSPLYIGFESVIPGSGDPGYVYTDHIDPITSVDVNINNTGEFIVLTWGFNEYSIFHIYSSDTPYGVFDLIDTVENNYNWAESITETKKFYHMRSSTGGYDPPKTIYIDLDGKVIE